MKENKDRIGTVEGQYLGVMVTERCVTGEGGEGCDETERATRTDG